MIEMQGADSSCMAERKVAIFSRAFKNFKCGKQERDDLVRGWMWKIFQTRE